MLNRLICYFKGHQFGHAMDIRTGKLFAQTEPIARSTIVVCIKCKHTKLIDNPWYKPSAEKGDGV